jgi:hypothetical protein
MAKEANAPEQSTTAVPWDEPSGMAKIPATPELLAQVRRAIDGEGLPPAVGDPEIMARLIRERIRQGTFDESLNPAEKLPALADDYLDRVIVFYGFHMNASTIKDPDQPEKKGVYAVVEVALPGSGEIETRSCGGANVLEQLVKAWEEDRFPFQAVLTGTKTGSGYTTYWLKRPEGA